MQYHSLFKTDSHDAGSAADFAVGSKRTVTQSSSLYIHILKNLLQFTVAFYLGQLYIKKIPVINPFLTNRLHLRKFQLIRLLPQYTTLHYNIYIYILYIRRFYLINYHQRLLEIISEFIQDVLIFCLHRVITNSCDQVDLTKLIYTGCGKIPERYEKFSALHFTGKWFKQKL